MGAHKHFKPILVPKCVLCVNNPWSENIECDELKAVFNSSSICRDNSLNQSLSV